MTQQEIIDFWKQSSDKDFLTMMHLHESGDFMWSLFIGHLVIEKLLKAYYVHRVDADYPMIHNLLRIAEKAGLDLTEEQQEFFSTVTGFNINARYDDYKQSFFRKCTPEFTSIWIEKIKDYRKWIKEQL
ncbi:MAG TPA: HEPN domain-containing protein [Bacteroidales bacterium]|nr:HEPN domain-containing protein [Bacteroidales bacterium]